MLGLGLNIFTLAIRRYFGGGGGQFAGSSLNLDFTSGNQSLDPRITFTRASTGTRINASGVMVSEAINGPRFDYDPVTLQPKGLLIEEQRTNSIRNNTMAGAVAGTPGTLPTNWLYEGIGLGTLSQQVVGVGVSNGINYVDLRLFGTTSTTGLPICQESRTAAAATSGQTWVLSTFLAIVGGSLNNISTIQIRHTGRTSAGAVSEVLAGSDIKASLTSTLQRFSQSSTYVNATTAFAQPTAANIIFASGVTIDITLRIGMPQLELGAFATSVIPTSGTAATRAADVAVITGANFSNWYRQDEGTLFAEGDAGLGNIACFASIDDTTTGNRIQLRRTTSDTFATFRMVSSGGSIDVILLSGSAVGVNKQAASFSAGNQSAAVNGTLFTGITSITPMPITNRLELGNGIGSASFNGHLRRISYFPRRLTNSELQGLTS